MIWISTFSFPVSPPPLPPFWSPHSPFPTAPRFLSCKVQTFTLAFESWCNPQQLPPFSPFSLFFLFPPFETWLHWIIYNHCTESLHWITHLVEERLGPGKVYSGFCRRTNKHKSNQKSRTWQKRDLAALKARTSSKLSTSPHYHKVVSAVQLFRICLLCQLLKEDPVKMIQLDIDLPASQNRRLYDQWVESLLLWQAFCQ